MKLQMRKHDEKCRESPRRFSSIIIPRQKLWAFLRKMRRDRVIMFTTHFLDEAETLGDRIAIMETGGRVRACGTAVGLKTSFNCGYKLGVELLERGPRPSESTVVTEKAASDHGPPLHLPVPVEATSSSGGLLCARKQVCSDHDEPL